MSEIIQLAEVDDVRDVIHRAVASLAQGFVALLPTGSGTALVASALHPQAVRRCMLLDADRPSPHRPAILLRGGGEAADWAATISEIEAKLIRRGWPGPLTLVTSIVEGRGLFDRLDPVVREAVARDAAVGIRVPEGLLHEVVRLSPGPIVAFDLAAGSAVGADEVDLQVVDPVEEGLGGGATAVVVEQGRCRVLEPGAFSQATVEAMTSTVWLFVCTGNTCRSPMAEALGKIMLAKKLGCPIDGLAARGYVLRSAGVGAGDGMPAASHAVDVVAKRGGSLKRHASRRATPKLLLEADLILALSGEHLEVILDVAPELAERARMLHPEGLDIADPVGSDLATYQDTAREIERCLAALIEEARIT